MNFDVCNSFFSIDIYANNGYVNVTWHDFYKFVQDLKVWVEEGAAKLYDTDSSFEFTVDEEHPFTPIEGLCFNFVSWLHYQNGGRGSYSPSSNLYHGDGDGVDLSLISEPIRNYLLTPVFVQWAKHKQKANGRRRSGNFPFGSDEFYDARRGLISMFEPGNERMEFIELFCEWFERNTESVL